jgi:hypothetical protein
VPKAPDPVVVAIENDEASIFVRVREDRARAAEASKRAEEQRREGDYRARLSAAFDDVRAAVRAAGPRKAATRSCIGAVLARAAAEPANTLTVIVTDADETCGQIRPLPPAAGDVVVVLLPGARDGEAIEARARERTDALHRALPNVRVVPWYRVDPSWTWLADASTPAAPAVPDQSSGAVPAAGIRGAARSYERPSVALVVAQDSAQPEQSGEIAMTTPRDGSQVGVTAPVRGRLIGSATEPAVFVHPTIVPLWWRANEVSRNGATWQGTAQFGTIDGEGVGEDFEVIAVALPPDVKIAAGEAVPHARFMALLGRVAHTDPVTVRRER